MPEIRIDRTNSGRRLLVILSKEREIDTEEFKLSKRVAKNTAITFSIESVPNPLAGWCKKFVEKVYVIAVDNL